MNKEFEEFINVKKSPISNCLDLSRYFIGRHNITPVYLTPQFEKEFNSKMYELEKLTKEKKELINYLKEEIIKQEYKLKTLDFGLDIVHTKSKIMTYKETLSKIEKR